MVHLRLGKSSLWPWCQWLSLWKDPQIKINTKPVHPLASSLHIHRACQRQVPSSAKWDEVLHFDATERSVRWIMMTDIYLYNWAADNCCHCNSNNSRPGLLSYLRLSEARIVWNEALLLFYLMACYQNHLVATNIWVPWHSNLTRPMVIFEKHSVCTLWGIHILRLFMRDQNFLQCQLLQRFWTKYQHLPFGTN